MLISNVDPFQPSFARFPVNDNTTGYKPASLPMVLVVPKRLDPTGNPVPNSEVFLTRKDPVTGVEYHVEGVKLLIENVPTQALVVGHQNRDANGNQIRRPDRELYSKEIIGDDFLNSLINLDSADIKYFKYGADQIKTYVLKTEAVSGDYFTYRTRSGVEADIIYYQGAFYYDLSLAQIDDMVVLPDDYYTMVYQTEYYRRNVLNEGRITQYICIDVLTKSLAFTTFLLNHPGQILGEFNRLTPPPYLEGKSFDQDSTIAFYRPFCTAIQDVYDEQDLLEVLNWIYEAPAELLPYLSYQLGWDIPFFPKSLDRQRRAVLRKIVSLQELKGSKQAVVSIFNLFGFDVLLSNLWWTTDGKRLVRPNEKLPPEYVNEEIVERLGYQFETVVAAVSADSPDLPGQVVFYRYDITTSQKFLSYDSYLLFRPQKPVIAEDVNILSDGGDLFLYAVKVVKGSTSDLILESISSQIYEDPAGFAESQNTDPNNKKIYTVNGVIYPKFLYEALDGQPILGLSTVIITGELSTNVKITNLGANAPFTETPVVNLENIFLPDAYTTIKFNRKSNRVNFTFNNPITNDERVYVFATYEKAVYDIPSVMIDRRSNYFDLELFLSGTLEQINPVTLNYAIDFLNKIKAMHSLLRTIRQRINLTENYEVTDLSVGGDVTQRFNTDIGMLQVPPAILPNFGSSRECFDYSPKNLGYKQEDIDLRNVKLDRVEAEFVASERLDRIPFSATIERIMPNIPQDTAKDFYTPYNQDRIITGSRDIVDDDVRDPAPNSGQLVGQPVDTVNPFPGSDVVLGELKSYKQLTTNSNSGLVNKMLRQSTSKGKTLEELDYITDYSYKGRVDDGLLYVQNATLPEEYSSLMCGLRLGNGTYYTYPYLARPANPGTVNPDQHSITNYIVYSGNSPKDATAYFEGNAALTYFDQPLNIPPFREYRDLLGKLYRDYGNSKDDNTIHYFNNRYSFDFDQRENLALTRPQLNITKPIMHFPGCRFPRLNRLKTNYISTTIKARPWDDQYSTYCGPRGSCGNINPTFLNVKQVPDTGGNTTIVFDDVSYNVLANNIDSDIPSLGIYTGHQNVDIVHKVYMGDAESNPAVTFDQVCPYDSAVNHDGTIDTNRPLFPFVYDGVDYADGYPCLSGIQNVDVTVTYAYEDALLALGLPNDVTGYVNVLFLLGSGMRIELGYRLSCPMENEYYNNDYRLYVNQDGDLQTDPDFLTMNNVMSPAERLSIVSYYLDGSIPSLLETV